MWLSANDRGMLKTMLNITLRHVRVFFWLNISLACFMKTQNCVAFIADIVGSIAVFVAFIAIHTLSVLIQWEDFKKFTSEIDNSIKLIQKNDNEI
jgi:hypothetical protein